MQQRRRNGFSLIELLVVISIVGVLAGIGITVNNGAQIRARDAKRKSDLNGVRTALYLYKQDAGKYCPGFASSGPCVDVGGTWAAAFSNGTYGADGSAANALSTIEPNYIKTVPRDPSFITDADDYYLVARVTTFVLSAKLENLSDSALVGLNCTPASGRNYCITD